jgi:hypothetical protein
MSSIQTLSKYLGLFLGLLSILGEKMVKNANRNVRYFSDFGGVCNISETDI